MKLNQYLGVTDDYRESRVKTSAKRDNAKFILLSNDKIKINLYTIEDLHFLSKKSYCLLDSGPVYCCLGFSKEHEVILNLKIYIIINFELNFKISHQ